MGEWVGWGPRQGAKLQAGSQGAPFWVRSEALVFGIIAACDFCRVLCQGLPPSAGWSGKFLEGGFDG